MSCEELVLAHHPNSLDIKWMSCDKREVDALSILVYKNIT